MHLSATEVNITSQNSKQIASRTLQLPMSYLTALDKIGTIPEINK